MAPMSWNRRMNSGPASTGLLDTSVVVDLNKLPPSVLPTTSLISAITLAELLQGVHLANGPVQRAIRLERIRAVEASFPEPLSFDSAAAREYATLVALVLGAGRNPKPRRLDLMIAATAAAIKVPVFTRNAKDLAGLHNRLKVISV